MVDTKAGRPTSVPSDTSNNNQINNSAQPQSDAIALPAHVAGSGRRDRLVETARDYARNAASDNTLKAYKADWTHFTRWCRMRGSEPLPPSPEQIGLYLTDLAAPADRAPTLSVTTIERRLSGLAWNAAQRGFTLDRTDRHIAAVLAGIKRKHARPPLQKEAILPQDIQAMVATLPLDLRGLRDRAILLIGYAGGLRRSEIVSLDVGRAATPERGGPVGARSKSVVDRPIGPARSMRSRSGCISQRSTSAPSSCARRGTANAHSRPACLTSTSPG